MFKNRLIYREVYTVPNFVNLLIKFLKIRIGTRSLAPGVGFSALFVIKNVKNNK